MICICAAKHFKFWMACRRAQWKMTVYTHALSNQLYPSIYTLQPLYTEQNNKKTHFDRQKIKREVKNIFSNEKKANKISKNYDPHVFLDALHFANICLHPVSFFHANRKNKCQWEWINTHIHIFKSASHAYIGSRWKKSTKTKAIHLHILFAHWKMKRNTFLFAFNSDRY